MKKFEAIAPVCVTSPSICSVGEPFVVRTDSPDRYLGTFFVCAHHLPSFLAQVLRDDREATAKVSWT